ncbi:MAG: hypothetical protein K8H84_03180 [Sulfuricella denitrificans]|nr:hypothetical protein [Sulfuricella denitrificans]
MNALKIPAYVPSAVRDYVTEFMEGANGSPGFLSLRDSKARELYEIEQRIAELAAAGDDTSALREECMEIKESYAYLKDRVACMQRFAQDLNMKGAYAHLTKELEDHQWERFLYSAWAACKDYQHNRERLKQAKKVRDEIAETADKLAVLLNESMTIGLNYPWEFFHIPTLLERTDNTESPNDRVMWQAQRPVVLGLPSRNENPENHVGATEAPTINIIILPDAGKQQEAAQIEPGERTRQAVGYAWQNAPYFPALLETVAQAARDYEPQETGATAAAIASQKSARKTEYLRSLAFLLKETYHINLSVGIMKAMAIAAMVALDDPDLDCSYDDVRKAIGSSKTKPLEDSGEK